MQDLRNMQNSNTYTGLDVNTTTIFMRQVYLWMTVGLGITAATAWYVAGSDAIKSLVFGNMVVLIGLIIAQLGLVFAISTAVQRMSAFTATALFMVYSGLTGVTLSSIFMRYDIGAISNAFIVTSGTFLVMSIYGWTTKRDLTALGSFLFMGLIGIIIASIVNYFLQSSMMDYIISAIGVLVFTGLTAYDTQKLKEFAANAPLDDATAVRRGVILGALTLYLDFVNLFIMMLRFMSGNRD